MTIAQWGFFSLPHLLWHGTSVYNGHLRGPVTLTPITECLAVELSLLVFTTKVCRGLDQNTQHSACGPTLLIFLGLCMYDICIWKQFYLQQSGNPNQPLFTTKTFASVLGLAYYTCACFSFIPHFTNETHLDHILARLFRALNIPRKTDILAYKFSRFHLQDALKVAPHLNLLQTVFPLELLGIYAHCTAIYYH